MKAFSMLIDRKKIKGKDEGSILIFLCVTRDNGIFLFFYVLGGGGVEVPQKGCKKN